MCPMQDPFDTKLGADPAKQPRESEPPRPNRDIRYPYKSKGHTPSISPPLLGRSNARVHSIRNEDSSNAIRRSGQNSHPFHPKFSDTDPRIHPDCPRRLLLRPKPGRYGVTGTRSSETAESGSCQTNPGKSTAVVPLIRHPIDPHNNPSGSAPEDRPPDLHPAGRSVCSRIDPGLDQRIQSNPRPDGSDTNRHGSSKPLFSIAFQTEFSKIESPALRTRPPSIRRGFRQEPEPIPLRLLHHRQPKPGLSHRL